MDAMIQEGLDRFDAVWKRVSDPNPSGPFQAPPSWPETQHDQEPAQFDPNILPEFIGEEICANLHMTALAGQFRGHSRNVLLRLAGEAQRRARRLRAEYFIRAGVPAPPGEKCKKLPGRLASLRTILLQGSELARRYERAAGQTDDKELQQLFQSYAAASSRRARELRALLIDSF